MKKIRLITAGFQTQNTQLQIMSPLIYKDYIIDLAFYNDGNTLSRINSLHPRLKSKIPKMMEWKFHPDYDYYIWVDSKFILYEGFLSYIMQYENQADLSLFQHQKRSSIKVEMDYMDAKMKNGDLYLNYRYEGEQMREQVNSYLDDVNFIDNQLFYGGCFMYSKKLVENKDYNMMSDWLLQCVLYSTQDQLPLPYLLYKHKVNYKAYSGDLLNNDFMIHGLVQKYKKNR